MTTLIANNYLCLPLRTVPDPDGPSEQNLDGYIQGVKYNISMWLSVCMSGVCVWTNMSVLYSIKSVELTLDHSKNLGFEDYALKPNYFCQLTQTVFGGQLTYFHWNIGVSRLWLSWPPKVGHQKFHACEMSGLDLRVGTQWLERTSEGRDRHLEMSPWSNGKREKLTNLYTIWLFNIQMSWKWAMICMWKMSNILQILLSWKHCQSCVHLVPCSIETTATFSKHQRQMRILYTWRKKWASSMEISVFEMEIFNLEVKRV